MIEAAFMRARRGELVEGGCLGGIGRTGTLFACERAGIVPDFLLLSKGITGGYLPLAATLATEDIFAAFLAPYARATESRSDARSTKRYPCSGALE